MTVLPETELSGRMRRLHSAGTHDLPENWLELADAFDRASRGYFDGSGDVSVQQFMGSFARARKAWCDVTGEALV